MGFRCGREGWWPRGGRRAGDRFAQTGAPDEYQTGGGGGGVTCIIMFEISRGIEIQEPPEDLAIKRSVRISETTLYFRTL